MILREWEKVAEKGISGDMVHDILGDWKEMVKKLKGLRDNWIGRVEDPGEEILDFDDQYIDSADELTKIIEGK